MNKSRSVCSYLVVAFVVSIILNIFMFVDSIDAYELSSSTPKLSIEVNNDNSKISVVDIQENENKDTTPKVDVFEKKENTKKSKKSKVKTKMSVRDSYVVEEQQKTLDMDRNTPVLDTPLVDDLDNDGYLDVTSCSDLQRIKNDLNNNYELVNNIDCLNFNYDSTGNSGFLPIGDYFNYFTGNFISRDYTIDNLYMYFDVNYYTYEKYYGLFSIVDTNSIIQAHLINSKVVVNKNISNSSREFYLGTIIGLNKGILKNSSVKGTIMGSSMDSPLHLYSGGLHIGGLVGTNGLDYNDVNLISAKIYQSYFDGNINCTMCKYSLVAGENNMTGSVQETYGILRSQEDDGFGMGSFVYKNSGLIKDVYAVYFGAKSENYTNHYIFAGMSNYNLRLPIENAFVVIIPESTNETIDVGLIAWDQYSSFNFPMMSDHINNSFWDTTFTDNYLDYNVPTCSYDLNCNNNGVEPRRYTNDLITASTYVGWDFNNIWTIHENGSYPYFRWQNTDTRISVLDWKLVTDLDNDGYLDVSSCSDLQRIKNDLNNNYELVNNIDCLNFNYNSTDNNGFLPIGDNNNFFTGNFISGDYIIDNLYMNYTIDTDAVRKYYGLFSVVDENSTIQAHLRNSNITITKRYHANSYEGPTTIFAGTIIGLNKGILKNSSVKGILAGSSSDRGKTMYFGGLVGVNGEIYDGNYDYNLITAQVYQSYFDGNVDCTNCRYSLAVSANYLTGSIKETYGILRNNVDNDNCAGSFVHGNSGLIKDVYAVYLDVQSKNHWYYDILSGIANYNLRLPIENALAVIIPKSSNELIDRGITAWDQTGLIAYNPPEEHLDNTFWDSAFTDAYLDYDVVSCSNDMNCTNNGVDSKRHTNHLVTTPTYVGWDFNNIWTIHEYGSYPYFQWQTLDTRTSVLEWKLVTDLDEDGYLDVNTCTDLQRIKNDLNNNYELVNDINCSGFNYDPKTPLGFLPLGINGDKFTGILKGNQHKIYNLNINYSNLDYVGLFGTLDNANVSDLAIYDININSNNSIVGGLSGRVIDSNISQVAVKGFMTGNNSVSGLFNICEDTNILNSYTDVVVSDNASVIGGICNIAYNSYIENTYLRVTPNLQKSKGILNNDTDSTTITSSYFGVGLNVIEIPTTPSVLEEASPKQFHESVTTVFNRDLVYSDTFNMWDFHSIWTTLGDDHTPLFQWETDYNGNYDDNSDIIVSPIDDVNSDVNIVIDPPVPPIDDSNSDQNIVVPPQDDGGSTGGGSSGGGSSSGGSSGGGSITPPNNVIEDPINPIDDDSNSSSVEEPINLEEKDELEEDDLILDSNTIGNYDLDNNSNSSHNPSGLTGYINISESNMNLIKSIFGLFIITYCVYLWNTYQSRTKYKTKYKRKITKK